MEAYLLDWLNLLVRWLHLITGIAWIGASFYFVMLDNSLSPPAKAADRERGVFGELWAAHGGGFYVSQKFLTGPKGEPLSANLHWSKWEAYTTWLSGMALLAIIYWFGASTWLVDRGVLDISPGIGVGWLVYDGLCRLLRGRENLLAASLFTFVVAMCWVLAHVFSARAAYLHVGVMLGTIMVANVFFVIIPGQKAMVADILAGREPDPAPGLAGKQRSVHNTYFTLPVLFVMISNHYPMTYSHPYGWAVLAVVMLAGVLIRQFFVLRHKSAAKAWLPIAAGALLVGVAAAIAPHGVAPGGPAVALVQVQAVIAQRCVPCHAARPLQAGFAQPPKGIMLETPEQIAAQAPKIGETVSNNVMPIGNLTQMTDDERALIAAWVAQGAKSR
ncbi:MAG: urate hydroxylase PuuD [Casimicrobiaceae bacterium]